MAKFTPVSLRPLYLLAIFAFAFDQLSKLLARHFLAQQSYDFGFFRFDLVFNTGAAYGLFSGFSQVLLILGVIVIIYLLFSLRQLVQVYLDGIAYGFIIAGAAGNTFDRFIYGKVTDFINIHIIPVFNFADVYLNIGIALIIYISFFYGKKESSSS